MTKQISTLFLLIIVIVSCSKNNSNNISEIFVDYKNCGNTDGINPGERFNNSNYLDSVVYVPLESSDSCIVGKVIDIHFVNDKLFVEDLHNIFVFSKDGSLFSRVSRFGRGHGEYVNLTSFDVNPSNDEISIYDQGKRMIHVYSVRGDFLRDVRIDNLPRDFCVMSNGNYLFYTPDEMKGNCRGVWQTDSNGKFINQPVVLAGPSKQAILSTRRNLLHINNNEVGLTGPMGFDNIYHVSTDTSYIAYHINTNKQIAKRFLKCNNVKDIYNQDIYCILDYTETESLIGFGIDDFKGNSMEVKYDKKSKKVYTQTNNGIVEAGFLSGDKVPFDIFEMRSDYGIGIGVVDAAVVMNLPCKDVVAPNCNENSNPIVSLFYYK